MKYLHRCNDISELATVHGGGSLYEEPYVGTYDNAVFYNKKYSFAGLEISPGPLYYNGTNYEIKDHWNYDSYGEVYGKNAGSYYFNFPEMGELFNKSGFSEEDGDIENLLNPLNGWRLPTQGDFDLLTTNNNNTRTGSTVNGTSGARYALIQLTGVSHAGSSTPNGLLLFPDDETISGKTLSGINNYTQTTGVTEEELNEYLNQGCVFLPASGILNLRTDWFDGGFATIYMSSTKDDNQYGLCLYLHNNGINSMFYINTWIYYCLVRCVRSIK